MSNLSTDLSADLKSSTLNEINTNSGQTDARWGFWMSCVWFAVYIVLTQMVLTVAVLQGFAFQDHVPLGRSALKHYSKDIATLLQASLYVNIISLPLIAMMVRSKKGSRWIDYMAWRSVSVLRTIGWMMLCMLAVYAAGVLHQVMGWPESGFMDNAGLASSPLILVLAVVVAAPICEELVFRGFMYSGFERSLGAWPALLLTSALFAVVHVQYNAYELVHIVILGLILGLARMRTRSIWVPMAMHALNNGLAALTVLYKG